MAAIAQKEPIALVILMAWGVLIEQVSSGVWWMEEVGKRMIADLSDMVGAGLNDRLDDAVRWARTQVALERVFF